MSHPEGPVLKFDHDERIEFAPAPTHPEPPAEESGTERNKKHKALELLEDVGHSTLLTPENNKRVLRRIDLRLLPILLVIYFLQQLDKTTISYGSVFGLIEEANLVGQEYSWLGSSIYLVQLVTQPVIAYILVKIRLGKFLAIIVFFWGVSLTCMTPAKNFGGLLACRIFLGLFESGIREFSASSVHLSKTNHVSPCLYRHYTDVVPSSGAAYAA
ncbi:Allantoate permease [Aspergillus sclerotialis]|uniref:Allantoate permease n=1 Tax=Aspergillus sclerotialis TaxID=2070753 RepID=A0A3A2ZQI4_9EURO|nr:Allantoate permease [Aspergillus sclerotialis]